MKRPRSTHSASFKQSVLEDYFTSEMTQHACARKWNIPFKTLNHWLRLCKVPQESVSLQENTPKTMDAKDRVIENLRLQLERAQREAEYNRLRATAYERLIEIVKIEDGIDLLKKDGAKQ